MNPLYQAAISGTLGPAPVGPAIPNATIVNRTEVPISLFQVVAVGQYPMFGSGIAPGSNPVGFGPAFANQYIIVRSSWTGAFMAVLTTVAGQSNYAVTCAMICAPNEIGSPPTPTATMPIPANPPNVLVGCGILPNGNVVTREQFWARQNDSYCLAAGEERTVSYTEVTGLQQSSTQQAIVSAAVSASASAGWGPVSASVSASLSKTSMTSQQVTVSSERTIYTSTTLNNTTAASSMFLRWQLMDILTLLTPTGAPMATIEGAQAPTLVAGPYNLLGLPDAEAKRELVESDAVRMASEHF